MIKPLLELLGQTEPKPTMFQRLSGLAKAIIPVQPVRTQIVQTQIVQTQIVKTRLDTDKLLRRSKVDIKAKDNAARKLEGTQKRAGVFKNKIRECNNKIAKSYQALEYSHQNGNSVESCEAIMRNIRNEKLSRKDFEGILKNYEEQDVLAKAEHEALVARNNLSKVCEKEIEPLRELVTDACFTAYISVIEMALSYRDDLDLFCKEHDANLANCRTIKLRPKVEQYFKDHRKNRDFLRGLLENF